MNDFLEKTPLDSVIADALPSDIPEELMREISPWRRIMNIIFVGVSAGIVASELYWADIFLGIAAAVLCVSGFSSLRKENRDFRLGMVFSSLKAVLYIVRIALSAAAKYLDLNLTAAESALYYINKLLMISILVAFLTALRAVEEKAGADLHTGYAGRIVLWYVVLQGLMIWDLLSGSPSGYRFLLRLATAVAAVLCAHAVYTLIKELEVPGYAVRTAPKRMPVHIAVLLALAVSAVLLGISAGLSRKPLEWSEVPESFGAEAEAVRVRLAEDQEGIPADITGMLTEDQILALNGGVSYKLIDTTSTSPYGETIRPFCYAVDRNDGSGRWIAVSGLVLTDGEPFRFTDGLEVKGYDYCTDQDVRLIYTSAGKRYAAELIREDHVTDLNGTDAYSPGSGRKGRLRPAPPSRGRM